MQEEIVHDSIQYVRCKHPSFIPEKLPLSQKIIRKFTKLDSKNKEAEKKQKIIPKNGL